MEKAKNFEKKEKPDILYISAQTSGLKELTPMKGRSRDKNEGAVIFSTPDKALASTFLIKDHEDRYTSIGFFGDTLVVVIKDDRENFLKKDKGGTMYTVSSDTFDCDPNKGLGEKEWTSREPVKPLSETHYSSALDTMIENGVQVYFVDEETFESINDPENDARYILPELISENQKRNQNVKSL